MLDQFIVYGVIAAALVLFIGGRWRYDVVALLALLTVTLTGVIPAERTFSGFSHPAVISVAAVLVVSRALMNAGAVDILARWAGRAGRRPTAQVFALTLPVIAISGFVSSIAAAAIMLPVAIRIARQRGTSPSILLMPIAFGCLLGAQLTLIGSQPNLIISGFRATTDAGGFRMFDYLPVGGAIAVAGLVFITIIGWRLIPRRRERAAAGEPFEIRDYVSEIRIPEGARLVGRPLRDLETATESGVTVVGLVRAHQSMPAPSSFEILRAGDVAIVEADSDEIAALVDEGGLELAGSEHLDEAILQTDDGERASGDDVSLVEAVVTNTSPAVGRTAAGLNLRWRYGINLLAIARQGTRLKTRLAHTSFRAGDVLLLQGRREALGESQPLLGLLPLAERGLRMGQPRRLAITLGVFVAAVAVTAAGTLRVDVAFAAAAVAMILLGLVTLREAYQSIDGSILVLLAAMIPVGEALEATGGAERIADGVLALAGAAAPVATLTAVMIVTMVLSDLINNAAAAVLMAPIALGIAEGLGASIDPFLMAVAVGASSAFLTPIAHQANTLVMGPGGYRFGDYWRMGLPLEIVIVAVGIPLIMRVWPLGV